MSVYPGTIIDELRQGEVKELFSVKTGIDKHPTNSVQVTLTGFSGDQQAETFHGGEERAILHYDSAHYASLASRFPGSGSLFVPGGFGENLVTSGMNESNMCVGDIVRAGTAILQVTQPRQPCFKLNHRFKQPTLSRFVQDNGKTGWFYRVLKEGTIHAGDPIEVIVRAWPQWSIAQILHYLYTETDNLAVTGQLAKLEPLGNEVKSVFQRRIENNDVEDWGGRLSGRSGGFEMRIINIVDEFKGIKRFILSRVDDGALPEYSAGAHIILQLPNGLSRAYSLCESWAENEYHIAVNHAPNSRGGSQYLHQTARPGDILTVSEPANYFSMARDKHHIFIAAGIGITPFIPMIEEALAREETFELHYCVSDVGSFAFRPQLEKYVEHVLIYSLDNPLDINQLLDTHARGTHVYTCGSPDFVQRVRESASHWHADYVHFENFAAEEQSGESAFVVTVRETGQKIQVEPQETMLHALRNHGIQLESACETGVCGKCRVDYDGEVDHRDSVLSQSERKSCMTPCVSRAKQAELTISLPKVNP
ncbi:MULTISPECIES: MOSC domain-containing protein [unclassified Cedecea]|uniref:MOSC domain-containing protein n=1 Tax=unclassified Cedecea TaxID=2649846 RepID=UPI00301760F1